MSFPSGHLQQHPIPSVVCDALGLDGYQLLVDLSGVGTGRLGNQIFLLVAADPDASGADPGTQLVLHQSRLRDEREAQVFIRLSAQLGYLRLSGYRLVLEPTGPRSKLHVVDPADGKVVLYIPDKHPGGFFSSGARSAPGMLAIARALAPAGPPPDLQNPDMLGQALVGLALADDSLDPAQAVDAAEKALALMQKDPTLDPAAAISVAKLT